MGNSQSNTKREKYKIYKITRIEERGGELNDFLEGRFYEQNYWTPDYIKETYRDLTDISDGLPNIRLHLNDYVNYKDGNYKHLNLDKKLYYEFELRYKTEDYLAIDLDMTTYKDNYHIFGKGSFLVQRPVEKDQVIEKRDSNGNFLGFICDTLEFLDGGGYRERNYATQLDARASNYARLRQTSYDMPPKW